MSFIDTPIVVEILKEEFMVKTLGKILWCDDDAIKPYFIDAGRANMRHQMNDSLEDKEFPRLRCVRVENCFFRVRIKRGTFQIPRECKKAYPKGILPVFRGYNHMEYQIRDPHGFAEMLDYIIRNNRMPDLPFLEEEKER